MTDQSAAGSHSVVQAADCNFAPVDSRRTAREGWHSSASAERNPVAADCYSSAPVGSHSLDLLPPGAQCSLGFAVEQCSLQMAVEHILAGCCRLVVRWRPRKSAAGPRKSAQQRHVPH